MNAMRTTWTPKTRRIGAREAERLLTGAAADADRHRLAALLAAASAPPTARELRGGDEAMAAFAWHNRAPEPNPSPRRRPVLSSLLTKALAVKLASGAAVLFIGGAAVAAETGNLPSNLQDTAHNLFSSLGVPAPSDRDGAGDRDHKGRAGEPGESPDPEHSRGPDATGPAAVGLCHAFEDGRKDVHGKALDSTAMRALAEAAGGESNIPSYCAKVLAAHASPSATPEPSGAPHPSGLPSETPGGHGNGNGHGHPTPTPSH
jgi:hypothetical protein